MAPDKRNRSASAVSGGASSTIIRAEVKAEDHISAKASPIRIARISIGSPRVRPCLAQGRGKGQRVRQSGPTPRRRAEVGVEMAAGRAFDGPDEAARQHDVARRQPHAHTAPAGAPARRCRSPGHPAPLRQGRFPRPRRRASRWRRPSAGRMGRGRMALRPQHDAGIRRIVGWCRRSSAALARGRVGAQDAGIEDLQRWAPHARCGQHLASRVTPARDRGAP
jgi:hypothetical protein